jgi:Type II secretion system (T2SS), protein E, N-terminal domain
MASTTPAVPPGIPESAEDAEAQALADERQLEFRARHQLTIDAQAHTLLEPKDAREMRAVPLGIESGRPVVAVADPSEKRLAAIREQVGADVKFVLVAPESLDALLKSRILSENDGAEVVPPPEQKLSTTADPAEPVPAPGETQQPVEPQAPEQEIVPAPAEPPPAAAEAVEAAPQPPPAAAPVIAQIPTELFDAANVRQLAQQLAQAAETLIALQTQVQGIAQQFDQTRQELREQKEQLAAAAAKADQDRARIKSVAASLAEDVARLDQTKADLAERLSGLVQDE